MNPANFCEICNSTESKYTCPKCNILYCSLNCYRAPSHQQCSEVFYRDCVTEELAARSANKNVPGSIQEAKRMYEILKRMDETLTGDVNVVEDGSIDGSEGFEDEELDSDDEDEGPDLATRLAGIDLDDPDAVWNHLTATEQQEFQSLLKTGDIQKIIPLFQPWWDIKIPKRLIQDMDTKLTNEPKLEHPQLLDNIRLFSEIMHKPPSPCLPNNLYNILSSYTCTVRFFNGEHQLSAVDASKYLIIHSATLKSNANFDDLEQAVKSVIAECNAGDGMPSWNEIACDVEKILAGPYEGKRDKIYVIAALSDIFRLFQQAKCLLKEVEGCEYLVKCLDKKKLISIIKKVQFFLSFANEVYQC